MLNTIIESVSGVSWLRSRAAFWSVPNSKNVTRRLRSSWSMGIVVGRGLEGTHSYAYQLRRAEALTKEENGPDPRDGGKLRGEEGRHRDVAFGAETDANEANDLSQPCGHHQWRSETR